MKPFNREIPDFGMQKGRRYEYDLLKAIPQTEALKNDEKYLFEKYGDKVPMWAAIDVLRDHQPKQMDSKTQEMKDWDPTNPPSQFLKDLKAEVEDELKLSPEKWDSIGAFTAVDSFADKNDNLPFSFDAFLVFKKGGRERFVTYDLTSNPEKERPRHNDTLLIVDPRIDSLLNIKPIEPAEPGEEETEEHKQVYAAFIKNAAQLTIDKLNKLGYTEKGGAAL